MPLAAGIVVIAILASSCATSASNAPQAAAGSSPNAHSGHEAAASMTPRVPAYRTKPIDRRSLPVTLDPAKFTTPYIAHSYRVAKEIPEVLAEQPCYCYCDAGFGHGSCLTVTLTITVRAARSVSRSHCLPRSSIARASQQTTFERPSSAVTGKVYS
jgi:hypothetical protein